MRKYLLYLLLSCNAFLYSQTEKHLIKANLLFTPSLTYEIGLNDNFTAKGEVGTSLTGFDNSTDTFIGVFPKFELQGKYYYNFENRVKKGKNTANNSANFLALVYHYSGKSSFINDNDRLTDFSLLGGVWGFQRTYGKSFSILFEIGAGYDFAYRDYNTFNGRPFPVIGFELGWVVFKK